MLNPDETEARRKLACNATFEISKLAGVVKKLTEAEEDGPVYFGIMSRIEALVSITYAAQRLYECTDEEFGKNDLEELQRRYNGMI